MDKPASMPDGHLRAPGAVVIVRGEDSFDFLQSQGTADLRPCHEGAIVRGLWLDHRGLIHAEARIWQARDGEWWLVSEAAGAEAMMERFARHIIADDVELVDATAAWRLLTMPAWPEALPLSGTADPVSRLADGNWFLGASGWPFAKGLDFLVSAEGAGSIRFQPVDSEAVESHRIQSGMPRMGTDVLPGRWNPYEVGWMEAVSLQKGCFLGQEVVARAHRLGRRSVRFVSGHTRTMDPVTGVPLPLTQEGVQVGEWTSMVRSDDGWRAIGWLKSRVPDGAFRTDDGHIWLIKSVGAD